MISSRVRSGNSLSHRDRGTGHDASDSEPSLTFTMLSARARANMNFKLNHWHELELKGAPFNLQVA
jgi:hypothetical protein